MAIVAGLKKISLPGRNSIYAVAMAIVATIAAPVDGLASGTDFLKSRGNGAAPPGAKQLCSTYRWACARGSSASLVSQGQMQVVRAVNTAVNRSTRSIEDRQQYGEAERWAMPTRRGGDCEDYALAKKRALIGKGIDPQRLLIATVLDRSRRPHAVLVVRTDQGDLVLDNVTNSIRSWRETRYVFLRMQDPRSPSRWIKVQSGG
ncbi:transglutaminase-like cysteine peptidase [Aliiroseovarius sp. F20344]|uniref:transglutaminase-like cysteine peptidase n=1 Tax=Aliiroseovarius sp. F20344 TaxID=2926414 RepID=UPI001FF66F36|nr:transglutaminase-like cysteine peptidase [Aliiroseovarius sp. F20344]MCK0143744.1 transglutaminase-like cysteine peptidase [Aliiroseovarius sp. F20344]